MSSGNDWRSGFLKLCGPGLLAGIKWNDWRRLLRQQGMSVDPRRFPRFVSITAQSLKNSLLARVEARHRDATELAEWKEAFVRFLKKVQLRGGRPLVLKSPPHTARVRLLLEMFPGARFIHIHRDPFRVFQSTRRTLQIISRWHGLQAWDFADLDDYILRQYVHMYDAFFADRELIPAGHYHEVGFEQLEQDPVAELRNAYEALGLPGFEGAEPRLRGYLHARRGYRKTDLSPLPPDVTERIAGRWGRYCERWGYAVPTLR